MKQLNNKKGSFRNTKPCLAYGNRYNNFCGYPWAKVCPKLIGVDAHCAWATSMPDKEWQKFVNKSYKEKEEITWRK